MHLKESVCKCCCSSLKIHKFSDWLEQHVQNTCITFERVAKSSCIWKKGKGNESSDCMWKSCCWYDEMLFCILWKFSTHAWVTSLRFCLVSTLRTCNQRPEVMLQLTALYLVSTESYSPARFTVVVFDIPSPSFNSPEKKQLFIDRCF